MMLHIANKVPYCETFQDLLLGNLSDSNLLFQVQDQWLNEKKRRRNFNPELS
jgi:hypothetical protein